MAAAESSEKVAIKYVGECTEGNCTFTIDCPDEATAHRTAGRHEGNTDLTHQVTIQAVIDDA